MQLLCPPQARAPLRRRADAAPPELVRRVYPPEPSLTERQSARGQCFGRRAVDKREGR